MTRKYKLVLLTVLLSSIVLSQGPLAFGRFLFVDRGISNDDLMVFLILPSLSYVLMIATVLLARMGRRGPSLTAIRWFGGNRRSTIGGTLALTAIMLLITVAFGVIAQVLNAGTGEGIFLSTLTPTTALLTMYTLRVGLATPVVEELFWRTYVQDEAQKLLGLPLGLLAQSILFASAHMRGPIDSLRLLFMGLVHGFWWGRRGTLVPLIMAHAILNGLGCFVLWEDELELRTVVAKHDYRASLEAICRPAHYEAGENAIYDYKEALASFTWKPSALSERDLSVRPERLSPEKTELLRAWISSNESAFRKFAIGAEKPYYWREYSREPMELIMYPPLKWQREIVSLVLSKAQIDAIDGRTQNCVADILMCYKFSQQLIGPRPLMEQLMRIAINKRTAEIALSILARNAMSPTDLKELQSGLEAISTRGVSPISFSGERLVCMAIIQQTFTDDGVGGGHIPQASIRCMIDPPLRSRAYGFRARSKWGKLSRRQTTELADEVFAYLDSIKERTPVEVRQDGRYPEDALKQIVGGDAFLEELTPGYLKAYHAAYRSRAIEGALVVVAAILRFQMEHGDLPDDLHQLVRKSYLDDLPRDPYGGSSFVYRRRPEGFLLYSLGPDFYDNGGVRAEANSGSYHTDDVFWPPTDD